MRTPHESFPSYWNEMNDCLSVHHPQLYRLLVQQPHISENITIFKARTGVLTIKYRDIVLHSMYDPVQEALRFIAGQDINVGDTVILYGFGLGYHVEACLRAVGSAGCVYVIEPNLAILKAACTLRNLCGLFEDKRMSVITGETEESIALRFLALVDRERALEQGKPPKIIVHDASFTSIPHGFDRLRTSFDMLLMERRTPDVFADKNIENIHKNLDTVLESPGMQQLAGRFSGKPALFINAGPSLESSLPSLRAIEQHAVLLCSDTALPALVDYGIVPDFVVSVDPQTKSGVHFHGYYDTHAILIYFPTSAHEVVLPYKGKKVVVLQKGHSITKCFEKILTHKGMTEQGSSVSCIGLDMLITMGCDPIIFVGMDYSFPGGKMYASSVAETKKWLLSCHQLHTLEMHHYESIHGAETMTVANKFGNEILTYQTLYAYLRHIEALIRETANVRFYNFGSQGVPIQGSEEIYLIEELEALAPERIDKQICLTSEEKNQEVRESIIRHLTQHVENRIG